MVAFAFLPEALALRAPALRAFAAFALLRGSMHIHSLTACATCGHQVDVPGVGLSLLLVCNLPVWLASGSVTAAASRAPPLNVRSSNVVALSICGTTICSTDALASTACGPTSPVQPSVGMRIMVLRTVCPEPNEQLRCGAWPATGRTNSCPLLWPF